MFNSHKLFLLLALLLSWSPLSLSQTGDPASLLMRETRAQETDANISWELSKHISFFNPTSTTRGVLLVHLVGTSDNPNSTLEFPKLAANNGFHVVSLKYPNNQGSAQGACSTSSDLNCHLNFRKEILEGINYSSEVDVNATDCVYNRLKKLLLHHQTNFSNENWGQYLTTDEINWSKIIVSGHSQGGGHAAVIALDHPVQRVLMFAAPNDYSTYFQAPATWTTAPSVVPDSAYFGFINYFDNSVGKFFWQYETWANLGLSAFGDTVLVDNTLTPFKNSRQLYTKIDAGGIGLANHSSMLIDTYTKDAQGNLRYVEVWKYMLGISLPNAALIEDDLIKEFRIDQNNSTNQIQVSRSLANQPAEIVVMNLLGQELLHTTMQAGSKQILLNLSTISSQLLFIKIGYRNSHRQGSEKQHSFKINYVAQ